MSQLFFPKKVGRRGGNLGLLHSFRATILLPIFSPADFVVRGAALRRGANASPRFFFFFPPIDAARRDGGRGKFPNRGSDAGYGQEHTPPSALKRAAGVPAPRGAGAALRVPPRCSPPPRMAGLRCLLLLGPGQRRHRTPSSGSPRVRFKCAG